MLQDRWTGKTIGAALAEASRRFGEREAIIFENGAVTFRRLQDRSGVLARGFLKLGVGRGDPVAIWMAGYAEWAYIYYALARIGAIIVPVNTRYKAAEVEYVLNKSKARFLVFKEEQPQKKDYLSLLGELAPAGGRSARLPHLEKIVAISHRRVPGCLSLEEIVEAGSGVSDEGLAAAESKVGSEDVALIQFTSGTTATPKGAMLYQNAMLRGAYYCSLPLRLCGGDRFFSPQPFFHVGGSIKVMLAPVVTGCTMVVQPYFDPGEALYLMEKHRCNVVMGHQPHYIEYLNHPDLKKRKLRLEKGLIFATPEVNRRAHEEMGIGRLLSPYGLTETHLGGTSCELDDPLEKRLYTVGRPMVGLELGVRAPNGEQFLPAGEAGEVCFRGWCIMKGYYDDPERTSEVLDESGWFRTGDLGVVDEEGYLRLIGRIKDMIRVGGENVAAAEVETFLLRHEKVKQAVTVGMPDERLGEVCVAFVELKSSAHATEEELLGYCRGGLASFKVPRKIFFVTEWPMSGTGKIQKYVLKESLGR